MNHDALSTFVAWFELVFGAVYFSLGLKSKGSLGMQYIAPLGLWFLLGAVLKFLDGHVPDGILITLYVLTFAVVGVWTVRAHRAFKAQARELARQREQLKS